MRLPRLGVLLLSFAACLLIVPLAQACQCSGPDPTKTPRQLAQLFTDGATLVLDGTLVRAEIGWRPSAAGGDGFVPATLGEFAKGPRMVFTFHIQHVYKGQASGDVSVFTGFGGGDCGAQFSPGFKYLLFLVADPSGNYGISMCSPGGNVVLPLVQSELRYLRGEPPTRDDLELPKHWSAQQERQAMDESHREALKIKKAFDSVSGIICGRVVTKSTDKQPGGGEVFFASIIGFSPIQPSEAYVQSDGSYCSNNLGPGQYKVRFRHGELSAYYPAAEGWNDARIVEVSEGQTVSGIDITPAKATAVSVYGAVTVERTSLLGETPIRVVLIPVDPCGPGGASVVEVPRVEILGSRFFRSANVRRGRYWAMISVAKDGWLSTKLMLTVEDGDKWISLRIKSAN